MILNEFFSLCLSVRLNNKRGNKMASPSEYQTTGNQQLCSKSRGISISLQKPQSAAPCALSLSLSLPPTHKHLSLPPLLSLSLSLSLFYWSSLAQSVPLQPLSTHSFSLFSSLPHTLIASLHLPLRPQTNWGRWPPLFPLSKPLSAAVARLLDYIVCMCVCVCVCVCVRLSVILIPQQQIQIQYKMSLHASYSMCESVWVCVCVSESMNMKVKILMAPFSSSSGLSKRHSLGLNMQLINSAC